MKNYPDLWLCFIASLPTENATVRMRAWRALKASGAAVLRDGVYLLPAGDEQRATLAQIAMDVRAGGGTALVLQAAEPAEGNFTTLFDRSPDYAAVLAELTALRAALTTASAATHLKQVRKLRKTYTALSAIDFFPGAARYQTDTALQELEQACALLQSPAEPQPGAGPIPRLQRVDYRGRQWATRQRPRVDRLASAWLIRRFIDPQAQFLWLVRPQDCPATALGFDFDGATFSHVGNRVTFEVLLASFALQQPALTRLGQLVHYLDVGGAPPPEAAGVDSVLAGLQAAIADDDQLLTAAQSVFDGLLASFTPGATP